MKRRSAAAILATAGLGFLLPFGGSADAAPSIGDVSWWSRNPAATAPEGGATLSNALDGPVSVAAVELDLEDGVTSATLSLPRTGGLGDGSAVIVGCVIPAGWAPSAGESLDDAPAAGCEGTSVEFTLADDVLSANVGGLVSGRTGTVGIFLTPADGETAPWQATYDPPTLQATAKPAATTTTTSRSTPTTARPTTTTSRSFAPPTTRAVTTTRPAITTTTTTEAGAIGPPPSSTTPTSSFELAQGVGVGGSDGEGRPIAQAVFFIVVAALVGAGAGVAHKVAADRAPA